ncbi:MAG: hypothetical protein RI885_319 [Actinomycetota bacterium]|jgi:hypothetical protein
MLTADDPVDWRPRRVAVAGVSGVGKTTLARRIGERLGIPHTEIDALFHGPDWMPLDSFEAEVHRATAGPEWVIEWQYDAARPLIAARADTMVWLDLPVPIALSRVIRRTVRRRLTREELWNGNREGPLTGFFTDPDHIVRWAIRTRGLTATRMRLLDGTHPRLRIVRLRTQRETEGWMARLPPA